MNSSSNLLACLVLYASIVVGVSSPHSFSVSSAFSSHMVLQREPANAVLWGWSVPGDTVTLTNSAPPQRTIANAQGKWRLVLAPQRAGKAFGSGNLTLRSAGGEQILLQDVLFGEVWLCTGQSNMGITVADLNPPLTSWSGDVNNGTLEAEHATAYPQVRFVTQETKASLNPVEQASTSGWQVPTSVNVHAFSAVCWMFGRRLNEHLEIPIGLVKIQVGGTAVELWSSAAARNRCNQSRIGKLAVCKAWSEEVCDASYPEFLGNCEENRSMLYQNSSLYNGMMYPWIQMAVHGAVWYQGESNVACSDVWAYTPGKNCPMSPTACADYYSCQFTAMIADMRESFSMPWIGTNTNFTFIFVGLPAYIENLPSTAFDGRNDTSLPLLRLSQLVALELPYTAMITAIDHGDLHSPYGSIHPRDKTPVAKRLLLAAREWAYGEPIVSSGPRVCGARLLKGRTAIIVSFDRRSVGPGGLMLRTNGTIRQKCAVGQRQGLSKCPPIPGVGPCSLVPASQCGAPSGFELAFDGGLRYAVDRVSIMPGGFSLSLEVPHEVQSKKEAGGKALKLWYLFADWPTPTVYSADTMLGEHGELPAPPFSVAVELAEDSGNADVLHV